MHNFILLPRRLSAQYYSIIDTYYRCTRKSPTIPCNDPFIREEALDTALSHLLRTVSLPPDWAEHMNEQMKKDSLESAHSVAPIVAGKQQEISKISIKLQRLLDSYLDQDIDRETYRKKKQDFIVKKQTLEESIPNFGHLVSQIL